MTDLLRVLPHFPVGQFARLIPTLEKHGISTSDLLTLEATDISKRTHLPLPDVGWLCSAVLDALHADFGVTSPAPTPLGPRQSNSGAEAGPEPEGDRPATEKPDAPQQNPTGPLRNTAASLSAQWQTISTLDPALDRALGGGIPAGYVTEITGESGAGKTQFLLTLLLSVQLPPPHGLGRPALYISTEAPLSTRRLAQMLSANPVLQRLPPSQRPSLDNIISTITPDLESQDHILTFQVPVEVERRGIGLIVIDSVAANYRAEFERSAAGRHGSNMAARSAELVKLGMQLRGLAQQHSLAVVVANQVADRFTNTTPASSLRQHHHHHHHPQQQQTQESPLATRSTNHHHHRPPQQQSQPPQTAETSLTLDHQQRWFTGWGDNPFPTHSSSASSSLKTPSLG
ncbi:DNA repair protein rhp57, partial [Chaetomidium leptoderma]